MNVFINFFERILNRFIERDYSKKTIYIFCSFILILMIFPILYLSFYNVMCADDFVYAHSTHFIWAENKSLSGIFKILISAFEQVKKTYMTWGGNYTSTFFSSIQPSAFNYKLTFLNTFIFIGFFLFSNFLFIMKICKSYFKFKTQTVFLFYTIVIFLSIQFMQSPVEALYWFNGSFYNIMGWSFSLFLLTLLIKIKEKNKVTILDILAGVIISIFIGGTAYSIIVPLFLILVLFTIDILNNKSLSKKTKITILFIVFIYVITSMISIIAPGNQRRQISNDQQNIIKAIFLSFSSGISFISKYFDYKLFLFSIFITPFLWNNLKIDKNKYKFPIILFIISFLIFSSSFTPTLRAMGNAGPCRTHNIYWWLFIMFYFLNLTYFVGWIKNTMKNNHFLTNIFDKQKLICFEIFILILLIFTFKGCYIYATSYQAIRELTSGEALQYKIQMNERNILYNNPKIDNVYIDKLIFEPSLLYFDDITEDSNDWRNTAVAKYFNKNSVSINSIEK